MYKYNTRTRAYANYPGFQGEHVLVPLKQNSVTIEILYIQSTAVKLICLRQTSTQTDRYAFLFQNIFKLFGNIEFENIKQAKTRLQW